MTPNLRSRFLAAMGLVVGVVVGAFGFGLWQFVEVLELELLNHTLARELGEFADRYAHEPGLVPPASADLRGYIQRGDEPDALPEALRMLPPGLHEGALIGETEYMVGRKDVDGARLYLALDVAPVEELEDQLIGLALLCAAAAFLLSVLSAIVLARVVMRPVTRLSRQVAELDPRRRGVRLVERFGDREVGQIAAALDGYLRQLDRYIEREQAFTEDASHELRTPLATILSATQLLLEESAVDGRARERLLRVQRAGQQMQSLIEALLFLAREPDEHVQDCALDTVIRDAVAVLRDAAAGRQIALEVQTQPVTRPAAPGMVACVVNNLLSNAIHHSGTRAVRVCLDDGGLTVEDRGGGVAPDDLSRIFERRYRGPESRGLGLGLYLVKRICDHLGWTVEVASGADGTRFHVRFPPALTKP